MNLRRCEAPRSRHGRQVPEVQQEREEGGQVPPRKACSKGNEERWRTPADQALNWSKGVRTSPFFEGDLFTVEANLHDLTGSKATFQNRHRQWVLDSALQYSTQWPGAELWVEAFVG